MSTINNTNYNCTVCDKSIVPNSHEHDHCMLVNHGYDLICQYCPFVCKTKCDNCVICEEAQIESESEDEPEEISTCNCCHDWDIRCGCSPPTADADAYCRTLTNSQNTLFWHKADTVEDNWPNCPNRIYKTADFAHSTLHRFAVDKQLKLVEHMGLRPKDWPEAKRQLLLHVYGDGDEDNDWAEDDFGDAATAIQRIWRRMKEQREDPPTVKPSRFSNSALDDMNVWCHECAKCEGWFAPCEHDMVCYSDHMTNPDVKCDCKCPNGCHDEDTSDI